MVYFYINKKDRVISRSGNYDTAFNCPLGFIRLFFFAEIKKAELSPLEIIPTCFIKPMSPEGNSIKPKNKYIIANYLMLVNMPFQKAFFKDFHHKSRIYKKINYIFIQNCNANCLYVISVTVSKEPKQLYYKLEL